LSWEPNLAEQQPLVVVRVGLRNNEMRVYLSADGEHPPRHVLRLLDVFKLFDSLPRGLTVRISHHFPHGSFGWDVPHREVSFDQDQRRR
jgi:hypothetical protein